MAEFDVALLRKSVEWVLEQDELEGKEREWDQGTWFEGRLGKLADGREIEGERYRPVEVSCGSSCCVAGKVCLVEGDTFMVEHEPGMRVGSRVDVEYVVTQEGAVEYIPLRARDLLGIDDNEANRLFRGHNSASGVLMIAREIAEEHGEELGL